MTIGKKYDTGKTRYDLIPPRTLEDFANVLTNGAEKYSEDNWKEVKEWRRRYYSACMRHLQAWYSGEVIDPEDGQTHLAHAMCCLTFLNELTYEEKGVESSKKVIVAEHDVIVHDLC